jgi:hypothetical protein
MRSVVSVAGLVLILLGVAIPAVGQQSPGRGSITIGRGRSLTAPVVNGLTRRLKGNAQALFKSAIFGTTVTKSKMQLSTNWLAYVDSLALYTCHQEKLTGDVVLFWPGKDPATCYQDYQRMQKRGPGGPADKTSVWDQVGLRCYLQYDVFNRKENGRSGPLVCWDEDGGKRYYCEYEKDKPEGLCCLFDQDELQAVLECRNGQPKSVTLVSDWEIRKRLSRVDAEDDPEGQAMLEKFTESERALEKESKGFIEAHKKLFHSSVAAVTTGKRKKMLANEAALEAARNESMRQLVNTVKQAPASQAYLWSPGNSYSPINVGSLYGAPE